MQQENSKDIRNSEPKKTWVEPEMIELPIGETRARITFATATDGGIDYS